jgi:hypothetical protein
MLRFATSLCCCLLLAASAAAQDAIWHEDDAGLTLYARIYTGSGTAVAVSLTPGTSGNTRLYKATVATVEGAGVDLTTELPFTVFQGTPSTSASDTARGSGVVGSAPLVIDEDGLTEIGAAVTEVLLTTATSDAGAGTVGRLWHYALAGYSASGQATLGFFANQPAASVDEEALAEAVADALEGQLGQTQPRINREPSPFTTIQVSRRADGTYKCTKPIRLTAGAVNNVYAFIDMSPLFGKQDFVETVGTATISGGSITQGTEKGPRDYYAVMELDGTATAGEERTVTVPVTMESGTTLNVVFDVEVLE